MKQRVITGIIFTVGVVLFVVPSLYWPLISVLFAIIVGAFALHELHQAFKAGDMHPNVPLTVSGNLTALTVVLVSYFCKWSITRHFPCIS